MAAATPGEPEDSIRYNRRLWTVAKAYAYWESLGDQGKPGIAQEGTQWFVVRHVNYPDDLRPLSAPAASSLLASGLLTQLAEGVYALNREAWADAQAAEAAEKERRAEAERQASLQYQEEEARLLHEAHRRKTEREKAALIASAAVGIGGTALAATALSTDPTEAARLKRLADADLDRRLRRRQQEEEAARRRRQQEEEDEADRRARQRRLDDSISGQSWRSSCDTSSCDSSCDTSSSCDSSCDTSSSCDSSSCDFSGGGSSEDW